MEASGNEGLHLTDKRTESHSHSPKKVNFVVVEDALVSKLVKTVLRKHGYSSVAVGPGEATNILNAAGVPEEILLTNSPAQFLEFSEKVPLLYLTSSPDPTMQAAFRSCRVVRKPFAPQELVQAVKDLTTV